MGCRTSDFLLSRALRTQDASPFIGHACLSEDLQKSALEKARSYLRGDSNRVRKLFREFPYLSAWCVSQALSESYGKNGNAIYEHLEGTLGVALSQPGIRQTLYQEFCRVCGKLGLPTIESGRMVDLYLLHAGVPFALLPALIRAFRSQETAFGPPPNQATVMLNRWEDDALEFLPPAVVTPRRAIQWDETAWHASLYIRILEDPDAFDPKLQVERQFLEEFLKLPPQGPLEGTGPLPAPPRPRLIWRAEGLALNVPRVEGRIRLWLDHDASPFRVRGGEDWILPQPWPTRLKWSVGDHEDQLNFLQTSEGLAVFDRITGRLVREIELRPGEIEINARDVVILSRQAFTLEGEATPEIGDSGFIAFARLRTSAIEIESGQRVLRLRARPRRRLSVIGGEIAGGPMGTLHASTAMIEVETGFEHDETRWLRVATPHQSVEVKVNVVGGSATVGLGDLLSSLPEAFCPNPLQFQIDLLAPADDPASASVSGISLRLWVWPAFLKSDGMVYVGKPGLGNLLPEQSQHVSIDGQGRLILDPRGGYVSARAAFEIEERVIPFDLPWPDVVVLRNRPDGSASALPWGSRLAIGEESRFDTVTVRCPDPLASLIVRGRVEERPFAHGLSRHLAVRDLLKAAADNKVILRRGNGNELVLFELVPTMAPTEVRYLAAHTEIRLYLTLTSPVDAVALDLQHETGESEFAEAGFGRRPLRSRRPSWLAAELHNGNPTEVELKLSTSEFVDGLTLARIHVRPDVPSEQQSTWRPLRNSRGETYAIILGRFDHTASDMNFQHRFENINNWLADSYAVDCWRSIRKPMVSRWRMLGAELANQPGGLGTLMIAGAVASPDHSVRSWIPVMHPIQFHPGLYGAPTGTFARLSGSLDPGVAELAKLSSLDRMRLRDQTQLHTTVYLAFRNRIEAQKTGVQLAGFQPAKFFANLPLVDSDPSTGWFWRGNPILGPDHWRAAHLRFVERLETAGMFTDELVETGDHGKRQGSILRLSRKIWAMTEESCRPPVPSRTSGQGKPMKLMLGLRRPSPNSLAQAGGEPWRTLQPDLDPNSGGRMRRFSARWRPCFAWRPSLSPSTCSFGSSQRIAHDRRT